MFSKFVIKDAKGFKYTFGGNLRAVEFTRPKPGASPLIPTATTWNLTKIEDAFGNEVIFKYIRGNLVPQLGYSESKTSTEADNNKFLSYECSSESYNYNYDCKLIEPSYLETIITKNSQIWFYSNTANDLEVKIPSIIPLINYTSKYTTEYGRYVDIKEKESLGIINYNDQPYEYPEKLNDDTDVAYGIMKSEYLRRKKLNRIIIYPNSDEINYRTNKLPEIDDELGDFSAGLKSIRLRYIEEADKRLMLESLIIEDVSHTQKKEYNFCYYHSSGFKLPDYGSFMIDHWGFCNGRKAILNGDDYDGYYSQREPSGDIRYHIEGMLKSIKYPTGGYTELEYEPHSYAAFFKRIPYSNVNGSPYGLRYIDIEEMETEISVGGLRVKSITSQESAETTAITKEYLYIKDSEHATIGSSSGYLNTLPKYYWNADLAVNDGGGKGGYNYLSSNSLLPLSVSGSHVSYSEVIEVEEGNGYTKNQFSMPTKTDPNNPKYEQFQDMPSFSSIGNPYYGRIIDVSHERGKLIKREIFDKLNNKKREAIYAYNSDENRFDNCIRSRRIETLNHCAENSTYYGGDAIEYLIYPFYLEKETIKDFYGDSEVVTTTSYKYTTEKQIREISKLQTDGTYKHIIYTYPYDYPKGTTFIDNLNLNHIYPPIEIVEYTSDANGQNGKILSGVINKYKEDGSGKRDEILELKNLTNTPISLSKFKFSNQSASGILPFENTNTSSFSVFKSIDGVYETKIRFEGFDLTGNLTQITENSGLTKSYIWSYKNTLPVAEITNASYDEAKDVLNSNGVSVTNIGNNNLPDEDLSSKMNILRENLTQSTVRSYTYNPIYNQLTSSTDENRITNHFIYDKLGQLVSIKDDNQKLLKSFEYHYDNTPRGCCEYIDCSYPQIEMESFEEGEIILNASISITNIDKEKIEKTIEFRIDDVVRTVTHEINSKETVEYQATFIANSINDNKLYITGACTAERKIPEEVFEITPILHHHGTNLPSSGSPGQTIYPRCKLENTGNVDGFACVNFILSKTSDGNNPIVSKNVCNEMNSGSKIDVSTSLKIPTNASGSYWLVMKSNTGNKLVSENTISIKTTPPPHSFTVSISKYPYESKHFNLSANVSGCNHSYSYRWSGDGLVDENPTGQSVECSQGRETVKYTVTVTCLNGGGSVSQSIYITDGLPPLE
jgi:YD repeat-containing protein